MMWAAWIGSLIFVGTIVWITAGAMINGATSEEMTELALGWHKEKQTTKRQRRQIANLERELVFARSMARANRND